MHKGNRKHTVWRDDKEATRQIYFHMLTETSLITTGEVRGNDVTPFWKVKVSFPWGFFSSKQTVNLRSLYVFSEWAVLSVCCSCNTSCQRSVEVNWFQEHCLHSRGIQRLLHQLLCFLFYLVFFSWSARALTDVLCLCNFGRGLYFCYNRLILKLWQ